MPCWFLMQFTLWGMGPGIYFWPADIPSAKAHRKHRSIDWPGTPLKQQPQSSALIGAKHLRVAGRHVAFDSPQKGESRASAVLTSVERKGSELLLMDGIHFAPLRNHEGSHCLLVFCIPGFLRWCRISCIHSMLALLSTWLLRRWSFPPSAARCTLPPTNIAPVGGYPEDDFPLGGTLCQLPC